MISILNKRLFSFAVKNSALTNKQPLVYTALRTLINSKDEATEQNRRAQQRDRVQGQQQQNQQGQQQNSQAEEQQDLGDIKKEFTGESSNQSEDMTTVCGEKDKESLDNYDETEDSRVHPYDRETGPTRPKIDVKILKAEQHRVQHSINTEEPYSTYPDKPIKSQAFDADVNDNWKPEQQQTSRK